MTPFSPGMSRSRQRYGSPSRRMSRHWAASSRTRPKQNLTKLSRLEPEHQTKAAKRLAEGTIKSVDEYTAGGAAAKREDNYYHTGAFIVDSFSQQNIALARVPDTYKLHLEHYREILSPEQIKTMIGIAKGSIKMLQDYIAFLNNELEVSE